MKELIQKYHIEIALSFPIQPVEHWLELAETATGIEGWVIQFDNGHMVKIKSVEYVHLHHLLTSSLHRENDMIQMILNETLDDVLANIPPDDPRRAYALDIATFLRGKIIEWTTEVLKPIYELNHDRKNSRKDFVMPNRSHPLFGVMMLCFDIHESGQFYWEKEDEIVFDLLKIFILKKTKSWEVSKVWLKSIGFEHERLTIKLMEE